MKRLSLIFSSQAPLKRVDIELRDKERVRERESEKGDEGDFGIFNMRSRF
jgi:hypothetical protein